MIPEKVNISMKVIPTLGDLYHHIIGKYGALKARVAHFRATREPPDLAVIKLLTNWRFQDVGMWLFCQHPITRQVGCDVDASARMIEFFRLSRLTADSTRVRNLGRRLHDLTE